MRDPSLAFAVEIEANWRRRQFHNPNEYARPIYRAPLQTTRSRYFEEKEGAPPVGLELLEKSPRKTTLPIQSSALSGAVAADVALNEFICLLPRLSVDQRQHVLMNALALARAFCGLRGPTRLETQSPLRAIGRGTFSVRSQKARPLSNSGDFTSG
jgi:hypothetical protein